MYLHLGQEVIIQSRCIIGIFDLDNTTVSRITRDYLSNMEKKGAVVTVSDELPKSFVVTRGSDGRETVYLSQISSATLRKRAGFIDELGLSGK